MKKRRTEDDRKIEVGVAYIHGRIEAEIERFANTLGIPPMELAHRLVELFSPAWERHGHRVPTLPGSSQQGRPALAEVEVAEQSSRRGASSGEGTTTGKANPHSWRNKDGSLMNAKQRIAEGRRRMKKRNWAAKRR